MPVKGYTSQSTSNIDLVNEGKELEERVLRYLDKIASIAVDREPRTAGGERLGSKIDMRCLALGRTNIQDGFMWTIRSIFNPQRISLPEDVT